MMETAKIKLILEAALLAAAEPLTIARMQALFDEDEQPSSAELNEILTAMLDDYAEHGFYLKKLASGYCFQARIDYAHWLARLWEEKPPRYSRALLETLVIIAYRQPVTRGDIEEIRGVAVSTNIIKTLMERDWVKVVGHRDVPGKPAIYGTSKAFLDYFNLESLQELPTLAEIKDIDALVERLDGQLPLEIIQTENADVEAMTAVTGQTDAANEQAIESASEESALQPETELNNDAELDSSQVSEHHAEITADPILMLDDEEEHSAQLESEEVEPA